MNSDSFLFYSKNSIESKKTASYLKVERKNMGHATFDQKRK